MKKLMLTAFILGLVATSCGSKEPSMSSEKDSINVTTTTVDTTATSTPMQSPDTMKMPVDTATTQMR